MEIKEIVDYFVNLETNILEISFRTIDDNEDEVRVDNIDYSVVTEYGYDLETDSFDLFEDDEDDEDSYEDKEKIELDIDDLTSFLNEYYTLNESSIPKSVPY
jgi:hypothetical protein